MRDRRHDTPGLDGVGLGGDYAVCGLALEHHAIAEPTEDRVEIAVGGGHPADVRRDETHRRERVADGHLEGRRIRAVCGLT